MERFIILASLVLSLSSSHYKEPVIHDYNFELWDAQTYSTRIKDVDDFQTRGHEIQAIHENKSVWLPLPTEDYNFKEQDF